MITNQQSRTRVDEVAAGIFRISTPVTALGGFTFNQYLIDDEQPLLFHTGPRLCGDLFTQGGAEHAPLTESDILGPSEALRSGLDYWAHATDTRRVLERLATLAPTTLACMHGSAWRGDGAALLRALADSLEGSLAAAAVPTSAGDSPLRGGPRPSAH